MNEKRDHHTSPAHYLKAWTIPEEPTRLWEYHRGTPYNPGHRADYHNPVKRALRKASVITNYYGPYENHLEAREQAAQPLIDRLRTLPPTNSTPLLTAGEKATITDYIGLFMKRTTAREERLGQLWKTVRPSETIKFEHTVTQLMNQGDFTRARELRDLLREYEAGMPQSIRQRSTIEPYNRVRNCIIELHWTFLTTTPVLLTSDNPIRYPEHEGLGHHLAFLTFPISTTMTLLAATDAFTTLIDLPRAGTGCGTTSTTEHQEAVLNHLTITGAHRYVYSHEAKEETARNFG